jgi:type II secretory pathway component PulF
MKETKKLSLKELFDLKVGQLNQKIKKSESEFVYGQNEDTKTGFIGQLENSLIESQNVSLKEKAFFYHLFSVLMNAGINTIQSLKILSNKTENQKFKRILNTISFDVEKGESLSRSMEKFPNTFGTAEIGVVKSGEATGTLDKMLTRLAEQTEEQNELITQLKSSLTYPAIVFVILGAAIFLMFGFVIPKLVALFVENNIELPTITKVMLFISTIIRDFWFLMIAGAVALGLVLSSYFQTENGKFQFDLLKLKIPIVGEIFKKVYLVRFFSTLGLLLDAGVPLQETISILSKVIDNEVYKLKTYDLKVDVQAGGKISDNLSKTPFLFPETVAKMLEIGERSASLSEMSMKVSKQYLGEVRYTLKNLTSIIGPIVIVIVGAFVAVFALAILGPVFKLSEGII